MHAGGGFELPWGPTGSEAARVHASLHEVQQQLERVEEERVTLSREARDSVRYHCFFVQQCNTLLQCPLPAARRAHAVNIQQSHGSRQLVARAVSCGGGGAARSRAAEAGAAAVQRGGGW